MTHDSYTVTTVHTRDSQRSLPPVEPSGANPANCMREEGPHPLHPPPPAAGEVDPAPAFGRGRRRKKERRRGEAKLPPFSGNFHPPSSQLTTSMDGRPHCGEGGKGGEAVTALAEIESDRGRRMNFLRADHLRYEESMPFEWRRRLVNTTRHTERPHAES